MTELRDGATARGGADSNNTASDERRTPEGRPAELSRDAVTDVDLIAAGAVVVPPCGVTPFGEEASHRGGRARGRRDGEEAGEGGEGEGGTSRPLCRRPLAVIDDSNNTATTATASD